MLKPAALVAALLFALVLPSFADDEPERPALKFDEVNTPLDRVIAKAAAAKKPIFIDFFLDG